ncbi:hypothetical protein N7445_005718 [Penicillium cf. griseofulvum]|nr:hypothetical protein N7445_005718 [Penicillium cf. griseofulvum]
MFVKQTPAEARTEKIRFERTWQPLATSVRNFRCIIEDFDDPSKRKAYLFCEARDQYGYWLKNKIHLDPIVRYDEGKLVYYTYPTTRLDTLSSNLANAYPRVYLKNGKLELIAYVNGPKGPKFQTITFDDLMNEDGVVFQASYGRSPKRVKLQQAREKEEREWYEAENARKEKERLEKEIRKSPLTPLEEWQEPLRQKIKELKEDKEADSKLPDFRAGANGAYYDRRIKDTEALMTEIPDHWTPTSKVEPRFMKEWQARKEWQEDLLRELKDLKETTGAKDGIVRGSYWHDKQKKVEEMLTQMPDWKPASKI